MCGRGGQAEEEHGDGVQLQGLRCSVADLQHVAGAVAANHHRKGVNCKPGHRHGMVERERLLSFHDEHVQYGCDHHRFSNIVRGFCSSKLVIGISSTINTSASNQTVQNLHFQ